MLKHISIKNYALIRSLDLEMNKGLTVMTGETGSGKSIILGAMGLVLGERADIKTLGLPTDKCIVEATFVISEDEKSFFETNNLDFFTETILRREITPSGKSRAFINDTPVTLAILKNLGERLVDIHSQHQNSILHHQKFQFSILDSFAGTTSKLEKYQRFFSEFQALSKKLENLKEENEKAKLDQDYFAFQLDEMQGLELENTDFDALEEELKMLSNAEEIKGALQTVSQGIEWSDQSLINTLNNVLSEINKISDFHSGINELKKRLDSVYIELKDIRLECDDFDEEIVLDTNRTNQISELLDKYYRLQQKHRVSSPHELKLKKQELEDKIHLNLLLDSQIEKLENNLLTLEKKMSEAVDDISKNRKKSTNKLKKEIEKIFAQLGLEKATINIKLSPLDNYNAFGREKISLEFSANPGSTLQPIQKVASGGEISRVMLALKAVFSNHAALPTLILDEIDNGVSGEIGKRLGEVMKTMSRQTQLITITHLPQIAGKGNHHLKVFKTFDENSTSTSIKVLDQQERIDELAEMLSGKNHSSAAKENARELLEE